ncbi:MAG: uncharacterized protein QG657_186 [Acidobacteriota bacterium]|nr:uncharacterized protein [Acidobacteriota bacterium]
MNEILNTVYPFEVDGNCFLFTPDTVSIYKVSRSTYEAAKQGDVKGIPSGGKDTANNDEGERGEMLKEIYIQVIHDCNLDCKYCYAGGGNFGGNPAKMDIATVEKAVDFFVSNLDPTVIGDLGFDGGEPFLNWDVIEHATAYAKNKAGQLKKKLFFHIGANGTLFNDRTNAFITGNHISLGVSIDGDKEAHDRNRQTRNHLGSYDTVVRNVKSILAVSDNVNLQGRVTITKTNLKCLDIVKHLLEIGFRHIYLEPVSGTVEPWIMSREDLDIIKNEFTQLAQFYTGALLKGQFFILRNFYIFLKRLHMKKRVHYRCGVGRSGPAITPMGDIFPCYKFSGLPQYRLGNVHNVHNVHGKPIDTEIQRQFIENQVDRRPGCRDCWARYLCGGGCAYLSLCKKNDIAVNDEQDCELSLHTAKLSLQIYAAVKMKNPKLWDAFFRQGIAEPS